MTGEDIMWNKYMIIATVSAVVGVILMWISMLQTIELTLRNIAWWGMLACAIVFLWAFLSLGEKAQS